MIAPGEPPPQLPPWAAYSPTQTLTFNKGSTCREALVTQISSLEIIPGDTKLCLHHPPEVWLPGCCFLPTNMHRASSVPQALCWALERQGSCPLAGDRGRGLWWHRKQGSIEGRPQHDAVSSCVRKILLCLFCKEVVQ